MSSSTFQLDAKIIEYLHETCVSETPEQRELRERTLTMERASMLSSPEQAQLVRLLIGLIGARRAIEIGVFTGYSALNVALALPSDGRLLALDVSSEWPAIGREFWERAGVANKIELRVAPARDSLDALLSDPSEAETWDFAFIDADKPNYDAYYERTLRLLRPGGLIAIDNTLWDGKVADPAINDADTEAIRALNAKVARDPRVDSSLVTIGDGLTLARKR